MYQFAQITLTAFDILTIAGDRDLLTCVKADLVQTWA